MIEVKEFDGWFVIRHYEPNRTHTLVPEAERGWFYLYFDENSSTREPFGQWTFSENLATKYRSKQEALARVLALKLEAV
jgi:hypothetical protein